MIESFEHWIPIEIASWYGVIDQWDFNEELMIRDFVNLPDFTDPVICYKKAFQSRELFNSLEWPKSIVFNFQTWNYMVLLEWPSDILNKLSY
jgi:hypothetical protein